MIKRLSLQLLCGMLLAVELYAQPQHRLDYGPVSFTHITSEDGLPQQAVFTILQDRHGFMWFGMMGGLSKYDGYRFTVYQHDPDDANSLSTGIVQAFLEDRDGILWIGHDGGGLSRFDPVTEIFTHYRHDEADPYSLSDDQVWVVYQDREGRLWVGTQLGLSRFDPSTERFIKIVPDDESRAGLGAVTSILEDASGALWVGTGSGLYRYRPLAGETGALTRFLVALDAGRFPGANWISALHVDRQGTLWAGGWGLYRFDPATETFEQFLMDPEAAGFSIWGANRVSAILEDHTGMFWIGCTAGWEDGGGLNRFDPASETFTRYRHDPNDVRSLNQDNVLSLYADRQGILWVGTLNGNGLNRFDLTARLFTTYPTDQAKPNSLRGGSARGMHLDRDSVLWVGTAGGVLNRLDRRTGRYTQYRLPGRAGSPAGHITTVRRDSRGTLWVGTLEGGLNGFDERTGRFTRYEHDPDDSTTISANEIWVFYEDRSGVLWIGTANGLNRFDTEDETFARYFYNRKDSTGFRINAVGSIYEDEAGHLWVGTVNGLYQFDVEAGRFIPYARGLPELSDNYGRVHHLYERSQEPGVLWIGLPAKGLYRLDVQARQVTHRYSLQNSDLPSNGIWSLLGDDGGYLWMSTHRGIVRFDPGREHFEVFGTEDGLLTLGFDMWGFHQGYNGELFFGNAGGVNGIQPGTMHNNPHPPEVALTGLRLFNEPVVAGPNAPLKTSITETDSVVFSHAQNDLTVEYVGLHFRHPERNQYAYMLEGYDDTWRAVDTERRAVYTSLPPGAYTFHVKAASSDGVWSAAGRSLHITIRPPWWRTLWAYAFYGLLFLGAAYGIASTQRRRLIRRERERAVQRELEQARQIEAMNIQLRDNERQLEAQNTLLEQQKQHLLELDAVKSRFFANISHEFRTPLTLILGPLNDALSGRRDPHHLARHAAVMRRNAHRLLRLINQLLDLAKLESGTMALRPAPGDFAVFLRDLVQAFTPLAERRKIMLRYQSECEALPVCFDQDKLEKVFSNLLSNALKFTPEGGKVWLTLSKRRAHAGCGQANDAAEDEPALCCTEVVVKDTGAGVPKEALSRIFDRFRQVDGTATRVHEGTGIGLSLARELVTLHGGQVLAETEPGFGAAFIVRLPLALAEAAQTHSDAGSAPSTPGTASVMLEMAALETAAVTETASDGAGTPDEQAPAILIVEDNAEVRAFLRRHLEEHYHIIEAADGVAGLEAARRAQPALILSDVMMPRMDGYALCRALKADDTLRAIPVVLLTARASEEDTMEGLETGADDYIPKPFNMSELRVRVDNLVASRQRLRRQFSREIMVQPAGIVVSSEEEAFLKRLLEVIEDCLGDSTFGVDQLADAVGLGRRQLTRRVRALTNEAPGTLIRRMRLERAAQLLKARAGTVSEIAYAVGFQSPSHFSVAFRDTYGTSPSDFFENGT